MGIYCPKCGNEIKEGASFCAGCGTKIEQQPVAPEPSQQPSQSMVPEQQYGQTQAYAPMQPKKSKTNLIIALVLIIVAVVVIAVVLLFVFQGGLSGDESNLVGTWEYTTYGMSVTYIFNSDGSLEIGSMGYTTEAGTWHISEGKLCMDYLGSYGGTDICYDYSLSGNQLTLSYQGIEVMKLTKS